MTNQPAPTYCTCGCSEADHKSNRCHHKCLPAAPTSAPSEQDRARELVEQFWPRLWPLKGTVHDLKEEIAVSIAAALQAERERTRAEDREACAKVAFDAVMALSNKRHHSRLQIGAVAAASIRALEAAQLPQGKDK